MGRPKKSLGQHWLTDDKTLEAICDAAGIEPEDTVLEIGPGRGSLTKHLVKRAKQVIAVELDETLAGMLLQSVPADNLEIAQADILKFDLSGLPARYKVVANIPYYLTSNLLRVLSEADNPPAMMVLLVQKEVARRICTVPGQMSMLSVSAQLYHNCALGLEVPAGLFYPPPKVDSQAVILKRREPPLFSGLDHKRLFQIVKAGFSERRKKLRSSLAGGLRMPKEDVEEVLNKAGVNPDARAQELSLEQWYEVYKGIGSRE